MEWKEALYTLNKQCILNDKEFETLLKLPMIRDEIFLSYYKNYGYVPREPIYSEEPIIHIFKSLDISLISKLNNRILKISFNFSNDCLNASFSDQIWNLNPDKNENEFIDFELLIRKKIHKPEDIEYKLLENYPGNLEDRIKGCLKQIRYNYDIYAQEIISGKEWDGDAFDKNYF